MQLFFGTMKGNRYVLEIGTAVQRTDAGNTQWYKHREADFRMADKDGNYVLSFTREFSDKWGKYSVSNIKRAMLATARQELS